MCVAAFPLPADPGNGLCALCFPIRGSVDNSGVRTPASNGTNFRHKPMIDYDNARHRCVFRHVVVCGETPRDSPLWPANIM